ncbi:hypothetical protein [Rahnella sp. PCH160]|uniref:hypothetical protein n=1 Tax=Rahnella sp. PCH160 TaxID=3447928 RepID=UPI0039FC3FF9
MQGVDLAFKEACRMIGECYLMLAEGDEGVSRCRVTAWLERVQEEAIDETGEPNVSLQTAIERLKGW